MQYRNMRFRQYSKLISHLFVAEKQQEIILCNGKQRPPGTLPTDHLPENHVILDPKQSSQSDNRSSHARGPKGNP